MLAFSTDTITPPNFESKCPIGYVPLSSEILDVILKGQSTFKEAVQVNYETGSEAYSEEYFLIKTTDTNLLHQMGVSIHALHFKFFVK